MKKFFNALRRERKKDEVIQEVTELIEGKIQYFKDLNGDKDDMEGMFREDLKDYLKLIECLYDDETPIEVVENKYWAMDTCPRESLYCLLEDFISFDDCLFDHCTSIDSVKRVMMDKGYNMKEEYFADVKVIHLTFYQYDYNKTSTFHKDNYTKKNVLDFCLEILAENR